MQRLALLLVLLLVILLLGCDSRPKDSPKKLRVITTIFPLYDFAQQVGGDHVLVENLLPPGVGPHELQLKPGDVQKLQGADLLIINGLGLETWVEKIARSNRNLVIINASVSIQGLIEKEGIMLESREGKKPRGQDPHVWLSPQRAMIQVKNIQRAFIKVDPDHKKDYLELGQNYLRALEDLDKAYRREIQAFKRKDFIAFHKAFQYLAVDYGLNQVAVFEEFPGRGPSPRILMNIVEIIKASGIRTLFSEPQFSPRIVEVIAKDLGLQVLELDTLETAAFGRDHYITQMQKNLESLKKGLGNEPESKN